MTDARLDCPTKEDIDLERLIMAAVWIQEGPESLCWGWMGQYRPNQRNVVGPCDPFVTLGDKCHYTAKRVSYLLHKHGVAGLHKRYGYDDASNRQPYAIRQTCRNLLCVNPLHLEGDTRKGCAVYLAKARRATAGKPRNAGLLAKYEMAYLALRGNKRLSMQLSEPLTGPKCPNCGR